MASFRAAVRPMRGWAALLIALPFALILAWQEPSRSPSRAELALALSRTGQSLVRGSDLRAIDCADRAGIYGLPCRWQQRDAGAWRNRSGQLTADADGWRLVETTRAP